MPQRKIRVAVIGGGNMGSNHVRKYIELSETELVAIADPNPEVRELAKKHKINFYDNYMEMLDKEDLDAVSVVVPTSLHYEIAAEIIGRKIHCMLEKPITSTINEGKKLIALAKKNNVVLTVGHVEHYNPVVIKLKELIDNKSLGDITSVVCKRVGGFPPREPKSDVIVDLAVHDIGIINYLLNDSPKHVYTHASQTLHSKKVDAAEILLDYGTSSGFIQVNWITPIKVRTIAITGSKGYVEANYITQELNFYEQNITKKTVEGFESFVHIMGEPKHHAIKVNFQEPLKRELQSFIDRIKGKDKDYLVSPAEALEALDGALKAVAKYE